MLTVNPNGYTIRWIQNYNSTVSRISYDRVEFLDIRVEFFNHSWITKITVNVLPTNAVGTQISPVVIYGDFSGELLLDSGLDPRNGSEILKDPERFVLNLIRITSDTGYWYSRLNNFLKNNYIPDTLSSSDPTDKDTKIAELMEEIQELKKELETMRCVMEEC